MGIRFNPFDLFSSNKRSCEEPSFYPSLGIKANFGSIGLYRHAVISSIMGADSFVSSLEGCIRAIRSLKRYLSYDDNLVRELAIRAIYLLIKMASSFLAKEPDKNKAKEAADFFLSIAKDLNALGNNGSTSQEGVPFEPDSVVSYLAEKSKPIQRTESNYEELKQECIELKDAVSSIDSASKGCINLESCIKAIGTIKKYLSYKFQSIRNYASEVISELALKSAKYLLRETNPKKLIEGARFLLETMKELYNLNGKTISLSGYSLSNLQKAEGIIQKLLKNIRLNNKDQFISLGIKY